MPTLLLPGGLCFAHLPLHVLLGALKRLLGVDDDPALAVLRQFQFSAEPVNGCVLGLLAVLAPLLEKRFGLGQGLRDAADLLDTCQVQLLHVSLTVHSIVGHRDIRLFHTSRNWVWVAVIAESLLTLSLLFPLRGCMCSGTSLPCVVAKASIHCLRSARWSRE